MRDDLARFRQAILDDAGLQEAIRGAGSVDEVVRLGGRHGFSFNRSDVEAAMAARRLTPAELAIVAGGQEPPDPVPVPEPPKPTPTPVPACPWYCADFFSVSYG